MQTITTTQLRTYTKELTHALSQGKTIKLIHRSKIIGSIKPAVVTSQTNKNKLTFSQAIKKAQKIFSKNSTLLPANKERLMQVYRNRLLKKHGKNIS